MVTTAPMAAAAPIDARVGKGAGIAIPFLPVGPPAAPAYASATLVASRPQIVTTQTLMAVAQPQVVAAAPQVVMQQPAIVAPQVVMQQQPVVVAAQPQQVVLQQPQQPTVVAGAPVAPTVQYVPTPVPAPYAVPVPVRYSTVRASMHTLLPRPTSVWPACMLIVLATHTPFLPVLWMPCHVLVAHHQQQRITTGEAD